MRRRVGSAARSAAIEQPCAAAIVLAATAAAGGVGAGAGVAAVVAAVAAIAAVSLALVIMTSNPVVQFNCERVVRVRCIATVVSGRLFAKRRCDVAGPIGDRRRRCSRTPLWRELRSPYRPPVPLHFLAEA